MRLLASLMSFSSASLYPFEGLKREIFENHLKMWDTFRDPATGLYCDNVFSNSAHKCGNYLNAPWYANWYSSAATGWVARQFRKRKIAQKKICAKRQLLKKIFVQKRELRRKIFAEKYNFAKEKFPNETIAHRDNRFFQSHFLLRNCFFAQLLFLRNFLGTQQVGASK
jgi:hypothetical protein